MIRPLKKTKYSLVLEKKSVQMIEVSEVICEASGTKLLSEIMAIIPLFAEQLCL
jgi:hypothetical protein